jgi:nucleoid DNA-binding protein
LGGEDSRKKSFSQMIYLLDISGKYQVIFPTELANQEKPEKERMLMNKEDLVNQVAKVVATKKEAEAVVDTIFGAIGKALREGDRVNLAGFGTFTVVDKPPRKGRNPKTGEEIDIAAKKVPKFNPGKGLKDAVK